jgi:hypothetical protein
MYAAIGNRFDVPPLFAMAAFFFSFGLFAILRPAALRNAMDNFANAWKQGSWHPYKMSLPALRLVVGGTVMLGAALFVYIAFTMLRR